MAKNYFDIEGKLTPLSTIKRNALKEVSKTSPSIIDTPIQDIVIALNKLPFVVTTIESCSGHIPYSSGTPARLEDTCKQYYVEHNEWFKQEENINSQQWRKFLDPKYVVASYFFEPHFVERLDRIQFKKNSKNVIPHQTAFLNLLDEDVNFSASYWEAIDLIETGTYPGQIFFASEEILAVDVFERVAKFIKDNGIPYESQISKMSQLILTDQIEFYDLSARAGCVPFLQLIYVKDSEEAKAFHQQLAAIFKSRIVSPDEEDLQRLKDEYANKPKARCYACGDYVSKCDCPWLLQNGQEIPKHALKGKRRKEEFEGLIRHFEKLLSRQIPYAYWHYEISKKATPKVKLQQLSAFWDKVRDLLARTKLT